MPTPIDWGRWKLCKATIEGCLREGYAPPNTADGKGSAVEEAQRRLQAAGKSKAAGRCWLSQWIDVQERRQARGQEHMLPDWTLFRRPNGVSLAPTSRVVERHVLTSAQNDTDLHAPFFDNLKAFASYLGARLHVGRFTYQLAAAADRAREPGEKTRKREPVWAPGLAEYLTDERVGIGDLWWCAEMNTLPTAVRPLSGLHTYGQGKTAIFPHAKVALETVAAGVDATPPCVLTTGACTVPSYSDTKAGLKGQFHHILGAVVVEVDSEGRTFFRHVIGKADGSFQDLDLMVEAGRIRTGERVEAITFGDCHVPFLDPQAARATWGIDAETMERIEGEPSIVDVLKPRYGFFHDLIDFKSISHHEEKQPRERFRTFLKGGHRVEGDVAAGARFLEATSRDWMRSVVVESNHGRWLERWLDRADHRKDRDNALAFLRWERARMEAEARGESDFNVLRHALVEAAKGRCRFDYVPDGGSYVICQASGGIECGAHGDLGPNGAKATPNALARVSGKASIGDKHSPGIYDGLYVAGVSSRLRLGYNKGPSSWRHAHVVAYETGKRALIFVDRGRWRA